MKKVIAIATAEVSALSLPWAHLVPFEPFPPVPVSGPISSRLEMDSNEKQSGM